MKKALAIMLVALSATAASAQSEIQLAREQQELREISRQMLNAKPSKEARKNAKQLKKEGWTVPAGARSIEQQIMEAQTYEMRYMKDDEGVETKRYILHTALQTAGTYNAGYAAARSTAQTELAAMMRTELVNAMQSKLDNAQLSSVSATTVDKFNQRAQSIIDATLTNTIPVLAIYRRLSNNNFEVQVRIVVDKKELASRLKRNLQKELEAEGDSLKPIVDEVLRDRL